MWGKEDVLSSFAELSADVVVVVLAMMQSFLFKIDIVSSLLISAVFVVVVVVKG